MKKKLMVLAMALGLSVAVLTGCSKPTVESLVDGMYEDSMDSQTAEMDMDMVLSLKASGVSADVSVGGSFEIQSSGLSGDGAQTSYVNGDISLDAMGSSENVGFEVYTVMEDDTVTTYLYNEDQDTWYKAEAEADDSESMDQETADEITEAMKNVIKENGELAEDTEEVEGEECYVITATIAGDDFATVCEPLKDTLNDAMEDAGMDLDMLSLFEYLSMDVTYYISKDTGYQVKSEIDMSATDLYGMVEQIVTDLGLGDYGVMDEIEDISFSECKFSCVMSDVNETEVEVPDDVIDNAEEVDESTDISNIVGGIGGSDITDPVEPDPVEPDPNEPDPNEPDPDETDPNGQDAGETDEWYLGDRFIFNKCDETEEFLCEVQIPDDYTYDEEFSDPEGGYVSLDRADGNGWIFVYNEALSPTYFGLIDGELPVDEYSELEVFQNYEIETKVIGTAFGGSDVLLAIENYEEDGYTYENTYICIEYSDGGYIEYLTVDCTSMDDLAEWTDSDYLKLAVDLFGN